MGFRRFFLVASLLAGVMSCGDGTSGVDRAGCANDDMPTRHKLIQAGLSTLPLPRQFASLFPDSRHQILVNNRWSTETVLYRRYRLSLQFPIEVDQRNATVMRTGEPEFRFWPAKLIEQYPNGVLHITYDWENVREFGHETWKIIVEDEGDLSVLGVEIVREPLPIRNIPFNVPIEEAIANGKQDPEKWFRDGIAEIEKQHPDAGGILSLHGRNQRISLLMQLLRRLEYWPASRPFEPADARRKEYLENAGYRSAVDALLVEMNALLDVKPKDWPIRENRGWLKHAIGDLKGAEDDAHLALNTPGLVPDVYQDGFRKLYATVVQEKSGKK